MATLRSPQELAEGGFIPASEVTSLAPVAARYAVAVSGEVVEMIRSAGTPIARQFLPSEAELQILPDEIADPIGDNAHARVEGIVHRHPDQVLFKAVSACPVYCRFCFRREQVGQGRANSLSPAALETAFDYIAAHPEIWEVILTGGDPFILSARRAADIVQRLAAIPHVQTIRWHTRVPMVEPSRVTDDLVAALIAPGVTNWVALHANHPAEFTPAARRAVARLVDAGIPLVSQSVLLKGVNDDVETLDTLMRAFVANRIKPYYLHHPDKAPGTSQFRVGIAEGCALMRSLRARLSGLALPTYVLDIPGGHAKVPLLSDDVEAMSPGHWRIRDHAGQWHDYRD